MKLCKDFLIAYNWTLEEEKKNYEASRKFFDGLAQFPRYKSRKRNSPSFYVDPIKIKFTQTHVKLENIALSKKKSKQKANWFRLAEIGRIPVGGKYFNPRVSFDGLNWFLTVGIEINEQYVKDIKKCNNEGIGIDLGVKDLAICSSGHVYKNINKTNRVRRLKKRQRRLQRQISRKYIKNKKGESYQKTRNIIKSEKKLLKLNHRLTNIRTDYIQQSTTESSVCNHKKLDLKLSDRTYICEYCGAVLNRDFNASVNLYHYGKLAVNH